MDALAIQERKQLETAIVDLEDIIFLKLEVYKWKQKSPNGRTVNQINDIIIEKR